MIKILWGFQIPPHAKIMALTVQQSKTADNNTFQLPSTCLHVVYARLFHTLIHICFYFFLLCVVRH